MPLSHELGVAPLSRGLSIHPFELAAELRRAHVAHVHRRLVHRDTSGNLHRGCVQAHGFDELDRRHRRGLLEFAVKRSAAHMRAGGHVVD